MKKIDWGVELLKQFSLGFVTAGLVCNLAVLEIVENVAIWTSGAACGIRCGMDVFGMVSILRLCDERLVGALFCSSHCAVD